MAPTPTLASPATLVLRQNGGGTTTTVTSIAQPTATQASTLEPGAIAGIVIGSIVGILLLMWLIRSCTAFSAAPGPQANPEGYGPSTRTRYRYDEGYPSSHHRRRSRSHHHYDDDGYGRERRHSSAHRHHHRSRSGRRSSVGPPVMVQTTSKGVSPRAPERVYVTREPRGRTLY